MGEIAKQSIKGTMVTYLGVAIGFVTTFFVLTRFLTSEEIGLARVLIDAATLFVGLAQLGTSSSAFRYFPYMERSHGAFFWTTLVPLIGFVLFGALYCILYEPLSQFFGDKSPLFISYYYLVLPISFFLLYQTIFETNANVLSHIVVPRFVREVVVRLSMLIAYLLYAFHIISLDGMVWAICGTYAIAAGINITYLIIITPRPLRNLFCPDFSFLHNHQEVVRSYILYTLFLIVTAITSVLAPTLSSFFITAQMGLSYTGIFAIATYIAVMVSIPYRSVTAITQPEMATAIKENDTPTIQRLLNQASTNLMLIGGFILLAIWINIDFIFLILPNGATYAVARQVVLLLGLGQLLVASFNIFLPTLSYSKFYALSLLNSLVLTIAALLLNNALIPVYGMEGAAAATLLSDLIYYALVVTVVSMVTHTRPFCRQHLYIILLIILIFALNYILSYAFASWSTAISAIVRSVILLGGGLYIVHITHLSPELYALLRQLHI